MAETVEIMQEIRARLPEVVMAEQTTPDGIPTLWVDAARVKELLRFLKFEIARPFRMLYDLTAIDERLRTQRTGQPDCAFTVIYHLLSTERNADVRVKVPLTATQGITTITDLWKNAEWYECELWDMFGIPVEGHPHLRRILLPPWWDGHPLRKEYPCRATEREPFSLDEDTQQEMEAAMRFDPAAWGMATEADGFEYMFINFGPHHPSTHGVFRVIAQLAGQEVHDLVCDIGYHHRGVEKMGERQTWHSFIPYTDRVEYLSGVMNNFSYVLAVEQLAGIDVPERAKVIRIMLAELFRIISHLVYLGTFASDLGMMSPIFYLFSDRERAFEIVEAITGARMHPSWFRIGGVAQDLPDGWIELVQAFVVYMEGRLPEIDASVLQNEIFIARTQNIGVFTVDEALEWGASGPMLRATGLPWDLRKTRPYGGYEQFDFEVAVGTNSDSLDRARVHLEEMRQSLRIIAQCVKIMPGGLYKAKHSLAVPPVRENMLHDIDTLINHFLGVSWGPVAPVGESSFTVEATKGMNSYYLISDGNTVSYRTRIRTPSFPHLQMIPMMGRGLTVADLIAVMGSIDFVMSDVDR